VRAFVLGAAQGGWEWFGGCQPASRWMASKGDTPHLSRPASRSCFRIATGRPVGSDAKAQKLEYRGQVAGARVGQTGASVFRPCTRYRSGK
jgi:hypothetical protein